MHRHRKLSKCHFLTSLKRNWVKTLVLILSSSSSSQSSSVCVPISRRRNTRADHGKLIKRYPVRIYALFFPTVGLRVEGTSFQPLLLTVSQLIHTPVGLSSLRCSFVFQVHIPAVVVPQKCKSVLCIHSCLVWRQSAIFTNK